VIEEMKMLLAGWCNYFKLARVKAALERLEKLIWRRMCCIIWRSVEATLNQGEEADETKATGGTRVQICR